MNAKMLVLSVTGLAVASIAANATAAPVPFTPDSNTQLLYHLDETTGTTVAADSSGHGRDAAYGSQVTLEAASVNAGFGTAIQAAQNNTQGHVQYNVPDWNTSVLNPANTPDFTLDAWIKLSSQPTSSNTRIITVQPYNNTGVDYALMLYTRDIGKETQATTLSFQDAGTVNKVFKYIDWETDTWYHVRAVVHQDFDTPDNSYITLYRGTAADDSLTQVTTSSGAGMIVQTNTGNTNARAFNIANYYGNNGKDFVPGLVDEVRFQTVPEPATGAMILLGGGLLALRRRRQS